MKEDLVHRSHRNDTNCTSSYVLPFDRGGVTCESRFGRTGGRRRTDILAAGSALNNEGEQPIFLLSHFAMISRIL